MSIKFNEVENIKKQKKTLNLTGEIKVKSDYLLVTLENNILVQADKYSEIGQIIEEALLMTLDDEDILNIKTWVINEYFLVIEVELNYG